MDRARLLRIKNLAAQRALAAYGKTLEEELDKAGLADARALIVALDGTQHIHDAVMFLGDAPPVLVRSAWLFNTSDEAIAKALARGKIEGEG